ncbi:hypothetical protein B0I35DRAFT_482331 [Stachybotrys elegans]|uniref:Uncharacterized protein n=1 Tax=Stachybotrys elegans TaxID=80388 RepID=A0A8K0WNK8_9HYPO|nr:hypothetical protein B0I35DRAFT_482331 [Stachybotrys elegans]
MSAPSAGTKVKAGQDGPTKQENAGLVKPESLASESLNEGGAFTSNTGIHSENLTSHSNQPGSQHNTRSSGKATSAGTAPTYVNNQYIRDPAGPHGKNLKEGDWDESKAEDGLKKALSSEPGSKDDPSRLAEQQFQMNRGNMGGNIANKPQPSGGKAAYDTLKSDESA